MKRCVSYILVLVVGFVIGILCRPKHFRGEVEMVQADTIVRLNTIKYSKLELIGKNYKLDLPKIKSPSLVYIPADSTTIICRDSVRYVTYPREFFFTSMDDVEIWHSGIDSTIDSLTVVRKTQEITKTTQIVPKRNSIGLGIETNYMTTLSTPIYLEYERMLKSWLSFHVQVAYDLPSRMYGVGIGLEMQLEW